MNTGTMRPVFPSALIVFLFPLVLYACGRSSGGGPAGGPTEPEGGSLVTLEPVFTPITFNQPVGLIQNPSGEMDWFLVEKDGIVWSFTNDDPLLDATVFIDISRLVESGPSETGLLGMALHPQFTSKHNVFLSYTAQDGNSLVSTISRFTSKDSGVTLDPSTEEVILTVEQPFDNHNGGHLAFGPDGYLYIGLGDGGAGGDPQGHGQNPETLLGSILRIDIDGGSPYAIPEDNPFISEGGRPEIYAWGLRNPWRFSFDRGTGELWVADVGQNKWEEVNKVQLGENYGWNIKEGTHCFEDDPCDSPNLADPIVEYSHAEGASVTGGFVYRGTSLDLLKGLYLYADFVSGKIWGLSFAQEGIPEPQLLIESGLSISSFAEGIDGELYVLDYETGSIFHIAETSGDDMPLNP